MTTSVDDGEEAPSTGTLHSSAPPKPKQGFSLLRAIKHGFLTWLVVVAVGTVINVGGPVDRSIPAMDAVEQSIASGYELGRIGQWLATAVFVASCFAQFVGRTIALSVLSLIVFVVVALVALR